MSGPHLQAVFRKWVYYLVRRITGETNERNSNTDKCDAQVGWYRLWRGFGVNQLLSTAGTGAVSRSGQMEAWRRWRVGLPGCRSAVGPSLHHARKSCDGGRYHG